MSDTFDKKNTIRTAETEKQTTVVHQLSMEYVLAQIEKIFEQTEYLNQVIEKLGNMADGDSAEGVNPENKIGKVKAQALGDVVRCRETTNQQLLRLYEKMYEDLRPRTLKDRALETVAEAVKNNSFTEDDFTALSNVLETVRSM